MVWSMLVLWVIQDVVQATCVSRGNGERRWKGGGERGRGGRVTVVQQRLTAVLSSSGVVVAHGNVGISPPVEALVVRQVHYLVLVERRKVIGRSPRPITIASTIGHVISHMTRVLRSTPGIGRLVRTRDPLFLMIMTKTMSF